MEKNRFQSLMTMAKTFQGVDNSDFWRGYQRGLRRFYHGENFGTLDEHQKWMSCRDGDYRRDLQTGYRAGFYQEQLKIDDPEDVQPLRKLLGLSVADLAEIAAVSPRTLEGWEQGRPMDERARQLIKKHIMI